MGRGGGGSACSHMTEMGMGRASENEGESPEYQESTPRLLSASKRKKESQTLRVTQKSGQALRCTEEAVLPRLEWRVGHSKEIVPPTAAWLPVSRPSWDWVGGGCLLI